MFNQANQNVSVITSSVQQVLIALRNSVNDAANVCQWVVAQAQADLVAIGFDSADATQLQAICTDIVNLLAMADGGAPAAQKNYLAEAIPLIGPNR